MSAATTQLGRDARVVGLVGGAHFFSHFYIMALPPLFPLLSTELGVSYTALGGIITAFALAAGVGMMPVGFIVDRFGARFVLIAGLGLMSTAYLLMGFASSYAALPVLAALGGLGNSVFHPADYAIINARVHERRLGRAFSIHSFTGYLGFALAPLLMSYLTALWDWRTAITLTGVAGLTMTLLLVLQRDWLRSEQRDERGRMTHVGRRRSLGADLALFRSPAALVLFLFFVISALTTLGISSQSVSALVALHGISTLTAAGALSGFFIGSAIGVLGGGLLADHTDRYDLVAAFGFTSASASIATIGLFDLPQPLVFAALGLTGFMLGAILPSRDMLVRALAPPGTIGKLYGFMSVGLEIGAASSPLLLGMMVDSGWPQGVFLSTALFMLGSLSAAVVAARWVRRREPEPEMARP